MMATYFVAACTNNNNAMLCYIDFFMHVVTIIAIMFIFYQLE
jgi:hypothetical protein